MIEKLTKAELLSILKAQKNQRRIKAFAIAKYGNSKGWLCTNIVKEMNSETQLPKTKCYEIIRIIKESDQKSQFLKGF